MAATARAVLLCERLELGDAWWSCRRLDYVLVYLCMWTVWPAMKTHQAARAFMLKWKVLDLSIGNVGEVALSSVKMGF